MISSVYLFISRILSPDKHMAYKAGARSEVGPSRLPVTEEIAGSNPVGPANRKRESHRKVVFVFLPGCSTGLLERLAQ